MRAVAADSQVVNCVQGHPSLPVLATSGIESAVRLWSPAEPAALLASAAAAPARAPGEARPRPTAAAPSRPPPSTRSLLDFQGASGGGSCLILLAAGAWCG